MLQLRVPLQRGPGPGPINARRGWGSAVGPVWLRARCRCRCAPSTVLIHALLAACLNRALAAVICGSGSACVSVLNVYS
jgi:hypothetical protein